MHHSPATLSILATAATFFLGLANAECEVRFYSDSVICKGMPDYADTVKENDLKCLPLGTASYIAHEFVGCDELFDQVSIFEYEKGAGTGCEDGLIGQTNATDGCYAQPWGGKKDGKDDLVVGSVSLEGYSGV